MSQWGGGLFSDGDGASFLRGRVPHGFGGIGFGGGGGVEKNRKMGAPQPPLQETLIPGGNFGI